MDEIGSPPSHDAPSTTLRLSVGGVSPTRRVAVLGDFTAWSPIDMPFDGHEHAIHVILPRQRQWRYRFRVDDELWLHDPDADEHECCADGHETSIRVT